MKIITLFLTIICFLFSCSGSNDTKQNFKQYSERIIKNLDNIDSYEMKVIYSEATTNTKSSFADFSKMLLKIVEHTEKFKDLNIPTSDEFKDLFDFKSICKMDVKYKRPNYLSIDANGTLAPQESTKGISQVIKIYTTFDGKKQKARSSNKIDKMINTSSVVMDTSINNSERPFDGWNLKGFGFLQGTEYIGTVKELLNSYDFAFSNSEGNTVVFSGTLNIDKMIETLSKSLPKEAAQMFAGMTAKMEKSFYIKIDTERDIVVGYFGEYESAFNTVKRICAFENIEINQNINPDAFTFKAMPNEKFDDITQMIQSSRKRSRQLMEGLK